MAENNKPANEVDINAMSLEEISRRYRARYLAQAVEQEGFEFDPCDGCGSQQECEAGQFPCKVTALKEYRARRASFACVVGISGITFVLMFALAAWQFQVPGFYALDALLVGFMGMTCAMGMLAGAILHQVFLDRKQRRLKDLPIQWVYQRMVLGSGIGHDLQGLIDGMLVALGIDGAAELHVNEVDAGVIEIIVVGKPGAARVNVPGWRAEPIKRHESDGEECEGPNTRRLRRIGNEGLSALGMDFSYKARKHEVKPSGPNTFDAPSPKPGIDFKERVIASGLVFNHDTMAVDPARDSKRLQMGVSYVIYPKVALAPFSQEQLASVCEKVELDLGNGVPVSIVPPASLAPKDLSPEGYGGFEIVLEKVTIHDVDLVDIRERLEKALNALVVA